jgi:hypothetical protein
MIYVYAIVSEPRLALGSLAGLAGAPVEVLDLSRIAALFSCHDGFPPEAAIDALQRHHRVVEAAASTGTVVPTRFGTTFRGLDDLEQVLIARQDRLAGLLRALRGKVELALRMCISPRIGAPDDVAKGLLAQLASKAAATVINRREAGMTTAAFLVGGDEVSSFQRCTADLLGNRPEVRASLTGPWPPYSFNDPALLSGPMVSLPLAAATPKRSTHV